VPVATPQPTPLPTPTVVPTPAQAYTTVVGGAPAGLDVDSNTGRFYLADSSGVIWSADAPDGQQRPTLSTPFNIGARLPVDLAIDKTTGYLYLSTRVCAPAAPGCILVVDGRNGTLIKSISLPGAPADLRLDHELGLLYVSIPERQALGEVDIRGGRLLQTVNGLPQITSLALDPLRHTLYAAHLAGQLTVVDVPSGQVTGRFSLTGAGLSSVATARGLAYAINTATHELAVVEPFSQSINRFLLSQEPSAVAAAEDTGAVYVLSSRSDVMLQLDPTDGSELGRVLLASRSSRPVAGGAGVQTLRPRMVLNASDDTLFASLPDAGTLAAVTIDQFPTLARAIPYVDVPDYAMADVIPGVLQPAAAALPAQPAPSFRAQAPAPQPTNDAAEEGL
jgi:DNA-binding beta-propeller fold protein YncE